MSSRPSEFPPCRQVNTSLSGTFPVHKVDTTCEKKLCSSVYSVSCWPPLFVCLFFLINLFIYFWLCWVFVFCARAFPSCGKRGPLFIAVRRPPTIAGSLVAEHRLQTRRLSSCGSRAQLLRGTRDPPRPGLEPMCPALAGRLSTTASPGKPGHLC